MLNLSATHKKIQLQSVTQGNSTFYTGVVDIQDFGAISTISAAEYIMNKTTIDDYEKDDLVYKTLEEGKSKGYQRQRESADKVRQIVSYIEDSNIITDGHLFKDFDEFQKPKQYHVIPNAILLAVKACELNNENNDCESSEDIIFDSETYILYISYSLLEASKKTNDEKNKKFFVIDGYHRMLGFEEYSKKQHNASFQFIASFLINRELSEEAEIFTTVNKTATKVDTSYYYHVVGEFEIGQREHVYLHHIARIYNEDTESIFHNKLKMLGKKDKDVEVQPLSQAFFIEQIYNCLMKDKGYINVSKFCTQVFPKRVPILRYYLIDKEQSHIARSLLLNYFTAISILVGKYSYPNNIEKCFYLKTLPFGAFVLILPIIYFMLLKDNYAVTNDLEKTICNAEIFSIDSFSKTIESLFEPATSNTNLPWVYEEYTTNYTKASSQGLLVGFANSISQKLLFNSDNLVEIQRKYYSLYNIRVSGKAIAVKI